MLNFQGGEFMTNYGDVTLYFIFMSNYFKFFKYSLMGDTPTYFIVFNSSFTEFCKNALHLFDYLFIKNIFFYCLKKLTMTSSSVLNLQRIEFYWIAVFSKKKNATRYLVFVCLRLIWWQQQKKKLKKKLLCTD